MTANPKLFGTDGVRGTYTPETGKGLINQETFYGLALATVDVLEPSRVVVGRDTRASGAVLAIAAMNGALRGGTHVIDPGVVPTPLTGWATGRIDGPTIGISITASHNPHGDNGFKVLKKNGEKVSVTEQAQIETAFYDQPAELGMSEHSSHRAVDPEMRDDYVCAITHKLREAFGELPLEGKVFVVDTAYGAARNITQDILHQLGAEIRSVDRTYNGKINDGYGANDLRGIKKYLRKYHDVTAGPNFIGALANDGDGDRVMGIAMIDRKPQVINGNHIMYYLAQGEDGIVGTDYTNSGLVSQLASEGIKFAYCPNGDAHVTEALRQKVAEGEPWRRGGEFTGHLIDTDHLLSGDGVYMAAWFACSVVSKGQTFADVYKSLPLWHEVMDNIQLEPQHISAISDPRLVDYIEKAKQELGSDGRLHIRPSGTEPLLRVWGESPDERHIQETIASIGKYARMLVEAS